MIVVGSMIEPKILTVKEGLVRKVRAEVQIDVDELEVAAEAQNVDGAEAGVHIGGAGVEVGVREEIEVEAKAQEGEKVEVNLLKDGKVVIAEALPSDMNPMLVLQGLYCLHQPQVI